MKKQIAVQYLVGKYLNESNYARMFSHFSSYLPPLTFFRLIAKTKILPSNAPVIVWWIQYIIIAAPNTGQIPAQV